MSKEDESVDPFEILKEIAQDGGIMRFGLKNELFIEVDPKDKVSIEMLEFIMDKYPEITFGELTEQLQNGIWWVYMTSVLSHQRKCKERFEAETINPKSLIDIKSFINRMRGNKK